MSRFISGDWNAICDRCGIEYKASKLRKEWTGLMVCPTCWEARHPQDLLRSRRDTQTVPWTRPPGEDTFRPAICSAEGRVSIAGYAVAGCAIVGLIPREYENIATYYRAPEPVDECQLNTVLLMHMDGENGSTTFLDEYGHPFTATGDAQISTSVSSTGALHLGGAGRLSTPASSDFLFGTGDFTIEFYYRPIAFSSTKYDFVVGVAGSTSSSRAWELCIGSTGLEFTFWNGNGGGSPMSITAPTWDTDKWYHIAIVKYGNWNHWFLDGVMQNYGYTLNPSMREVESPLVIGDMDYRDYFRPIYPANCYIKDLRISKNACYTENFTPPPSPVV